ncbi:MAG: type II secretion system protein GspE [Planctomycetota bacterium]|nr:MAG: type II secretion system protein GspE [Planctomycetota bacterium]
MLANFDKKLGRILIKRGILSNEEMEIAYDAAEHEKKNLTSVLADKSMLTEKEVIAAISLETNHPPIDIEKVTVAEDVLETISQESAEQYCVLPVAKLGNFLTVAVADPFNVVKLDDLRMLSGCEIRPVISSENAIREAVKKVFSKSDQIVSDFMDDMRGADDVEYQQDKEEDLDIQGEIAGSEDAAIVKLAYMIILQAIKERASDIHIEPYDRRVRVRIRIDGILHELLEIPKVTFPKLISRVKIMANLDIAERKKCQDGRIRIRLEGRNVDFRVSLLPTVHGEKIVMRILDTSSLSLALDTLGFEPKCLSDLRKAINTPYGMMVVTGPTGSGKTTTLYSAIREILSDEDNITTVEDPVEYQVEGVNQVQVDRKRDITFANALRAILRQDPDTVMIGEIRDSETIEIAIKAALTGHLVFSTLHTNNSAESIIRIADMGIPAYLVASTLILITAQRLGRKLCLQCREPMAEVPMDKLLEIGFTPDDFKEDFTLYRAAGCNLCKGVGYRGRFAILETMELTEKLRRMIVDGANTLDINDTAVKGGMLSLHRVGILNVLRGVTSIDNLLETTRVNI